MSLLSDEYIHALQSLQDRAVSFPDEVARREVEQVLGKSTLELFVEFEAHLMAAASITQVLKTRQRDGRLVVVKIRRLLIKAQIDSDMRLLPEVRSIAVNLLLLKRTREGIRARDPAAAAKVSA